MLGKIIISFYRYFYTRNVALYGNCFIFNAEYNADKDSLAGSRTSSLTGPSFGLNLIITLDQLNYMRGGITKQVCEEGDIISDLVKSVKITQNIKLNITKMITKI